MKTVLFAWELGAGAGHLVNMRRLAQRLQRDDIRLVAAVTSLESVELLDNIQEIHRMPNWPKPRLDGPPSSATMTDMLVAAGMNDASAVHHIVAAWDRLLRQINPSIVIADYAPGVSLAARGRIPLLQVGSGFTLPPHDMERFPALHDMSALVNPDEVTLQAVNDALRQLGLPALQHLPQMFAGDGRLVYVLPLIDPYAAQRTPPADGPLLAYRPRARNPDAQEVFVYIASDTQVRADVVAALRPVAGRAYIYAPQLAEQTQRELADAGARILTGHADLSNALPRCRLAVHPGGSGFCNEAALAGVPQLTLVTHVERYLHGIALQRAGIGRLFLAHDPASRLADDTIDGMYHDEVLQQRARDLSAQLRAELPQISAGERFEIECRRLLG